MKKNNMLVHIIFFTKKKPHYYKYYLLENRVFALLHIHQSVQLDQKYCSQNQLNNFLEIKLCDVSGTRSTQIKHGFSSFSPKCWWFFQVELTECFKHEQCRLWQKPFITGLLHLSQFLKGTLLLLEHTRLKCNLVNFEIPNRFLYYGNEFGIPKLTRLHFKWACSRSRLPFKKVRSMQQQTWYSYLFIFIYYIEKSTNANIDIYWSIILFYCQTSTKFIGKKPSHFDQIPLLWKMKKHSSAWWRKLCVS